MYDRYIESDGDRLYPAYICVDTYCNKNNISPYYFEYE